MDLQSQSGANLWLKRLLLLGAGSVAARLLLASHLGTTGAFYIFVPFLLALLLLRFRATTPQTKWWQEYWRLTVDTTIMMLASSALLWEGFICVLFFMPLFYLIMTLTFLSHWVSRQRASRARHLSVALPVLLLAASLEGTTAFTSLPRETTVTVTRHVASTPAELMDNISKPFSLNSGLNSGLNNVLEERRHWLLAVFPMPHTITSESMDVGAIHTVHTRYHRWFVTNTHNGRMDLEIIESSPTIIATRVQADTTYFSTYLDLHGTKVELQAHDSQTTNIILTITYSRKLDPAWYFAPLQELVMTQMAEFLIDRVIQRV